MSSPARQALYLDGAAGPVFAVLHEPDAATAQDTAVLLCPPFGWEEVCSYRSRRWWAAQLAADGYASLRLSFPGTGDSGGSPHDPGRLEAWTNAVAGAGGWLRSAVGADRLAVIGIALGGLVAYRAAARGAEFDDLVLWATPARGKALVRELRAFSRLEAPLFFEGLDPPPSPLPPGDLEAGGFLISAETVRELEALDLTELELPRAPERRVLLLGRDGLAADQRLRGTLDRAEAALTVAPGDGYGMMTSHPQQAIPPAAVIQRVSSWLHEGSGPATPATAHRACAPPPGALGAAEIQTRNGGLVRETPFTVARSFGNLDGVLVEPTEAREDDLCVVMLNAGAVRRIGPNRMWVEAARRWASRGIPTLRLDVEGIGEADGDERPYKDDERLYVPDLIPQVLAALDALQERGIAQRFVLVGLCAGAYWSFHGALRDPRVDAAWLINPRTLVWDPNLAAARDLRTLFEAPSWAKVRRSFSVARLRALIGWALGAPARRLLSLCSSQARAAAAGVQIDQLLDEWRASRKRALLLFAADEPLDKELSRSGRMKRIEDWPSVSVVRIAARDHSLRPNWAQRRAHDALDDALERELAASGVACGSE